METAYTIPRRRDVSKLCTLYLCDYFSDVIIHMHIVLSLILRFYSFLHQYPRSK